MIQTTGQYNPVNSGGSYTIRFTDNMLLGYGICEHTFARLIGYFSYAFLGRAIFGQWLCLLIWMLMLGIFIINKTRNKSTALLMLSVGLYSAFLGLMYFLFPDTQQFYAEYSTEIATVIIIGVPCSVLLNQTKDLNALILSFRPVLRIGTVLCLLGLIFGARINYLSSMGWGMAIMPMALFYYGHNRIVKRNQLFELHWIDKLLQASTVIMTFLGGRQWIVIVFGAIFFCSIWEADTRKQKLLRTFWGTIVIVLFVVFYDSALNILGSIINRIGIESRALTSIANGRLLDTYSRNSIYTYCQDIIRKNGSRISGLFADRFYLRQYRANIAYAHNFFYELLIDFGTILGGIIITLFLFLVIKSYIKCQKDMKIAFVLFFFYGFLRFLISSSFLIEINCIVLFGLLLNKNIRNKKYDEYIS